MSELQKNTIFERLKAFTDARIFIARTGHSITTNELLKFEYAHASAKDAVYSTLLNEQLITSIKNELEQDFIELRSFANNRTEYLKRPDLGRKLNSDSIKKLELLEQKEFTLAIIIADGLSANAVNEHAIPFLKLFLSLIKTNGWKTAPICIVNQARVAIGDQIGAILKAEITVICIGERPGLSSSDSMGIYFTYHPHQGLTDESRNCISNIKKRGLSYESAADKLYYLVQKALHLKLSGVQLKDDFETSLK
jgi:ethanolamine ammonia-lyase small subunit